MKKIIHKLRNKKHEDRRTILHFVLVVCVLLLGFLFSYTLKANIRENKEEIKSDFKDFENLKESLSDDLENFSNN
jgi:CHASE3 domain sensor protein